MLITGDSLHELKKLDANSIDAVVTDPPYGLSFVGKKWDYDVPSVEIWREVLRVLKPGGHLLSFGGTRTYHRMVVNIEDAGFEIRDQIQWLYGSGFPKSHDVSKGIDKAKGAEREIVGLNPSSRPNSKKQNMRGFDNREDAPEDSAGVQMLTAPSTDLAKQWQGWGTALKPANEPICLARKPLEGTVAQNVEKWGVGGLNIDGTRIEGQRRTEYGLKDATRSNTNVYGTDGTSADFDSSKGRWPANIILDETAAAMLDEQTQHLHSAGSARKAKRECGDTESIFGMGKGDGHRLGDSGGASRFFYVAKASKSERNAGLEGMPKVTARSGMGGEMPVDDDGKERDRFSVTQANHHPTVKPIKLMEYLCKLITPPNGVILDPFMGSGSTGVAAKNLGFEFVGIELQAEYAEIANKRIANSREA